MERERERERERRLKICTVARQFFIARRRRIRCGRTPFKNFKKTNSAATTSSSSSSSSSSCRCLEFTTHTDSAEAHKGSNTGRGFYFRMQSSIFRDSGLYIKVFLNGQFPASFFFNFVFSIFNSKYIHYNFCRTPDLWYQKQPLYQLSHSKCTTRIHLFD